MILSSDYLVPCLCLHPCWRHHTAADAGADDSMREVRRLLKEKAHLLATHLYSSHDPVIQQLDMRIQQLAEQSSSADATS